MRKPKETTVKTVNGGYMVTTIRYYGREAVNYNHWFKTEKEVANYLNRVKF